MKEFENQGQPSHRFSRKHPAHGVLYLRGQPTIIFDTVCTKDRNPWLANDEVHQLLREVWQEATAWLMGRYVILPDHIHFFAGATGSHIEYDRWVTYWKSQFTKKHRVPGHRWLADHWDRRMRSPEHYEEKWEYVRWNPVRRGLVSHPDEWAYQGEIHEIGWV
jgi:putative transposase